VGRLILRRLGATVPVLLLVTAGVFSLLHLTPGDPIDAMMAESQDATAKAALRAELGLDRPIALQYAAWMGRVLRGDLGRSVLTANPVLADIRRVFPATLELATVGTLIGVLVGIPILYTLGVVLLIVGLVLMLVGRSGTAFAGRRHYW
jgi:peptide/nickel transport system permease protein